VGQENGPTFNGQAVHDAFWTAWPLKEGTTTPVFHLHEPYPDGKELRASLSEQKSVIPDHKFYLCAASDDTRRQKL
jgi:hypothetical protein